MSKEISKFEYISKKELKKAKKIFRDLFDFLISKRDEDIKSFNYSIVGSSKNSLVLGEIQPNNKKIFDIDFNITFHKKQSKKPLEIKEYFFKKIKEFLKIKEINSIASDDHKSIIRIDFPDENYSYDIAIIYLNKETNEIEIIRRNGLKELVWETSKKYFCANQFISNHKKTPNFKNEIRDEYKKIKENDHSPKHHKISSNLLFETINNIMENSKIKFSTEDLNKWWNCKILKI